MNLLVHDKEMLEKYKKIWKKLKVYFKKNVIMNQFIMVNILKLK